MGHCGRLIEMKHRRPASLVTLLPCRVGPQFESGVVVNVPASLHGTVMSLPGEPIHVWHACASWPCEVVKAHFPVQGMRKLSDYSRDVSLGIRTNHSSLTSGIYTCPTGKGSLLQLANAAVVLENGHGLSNTDHLHWG
jgi:hypothetical protein